MSANEPERKRLSSLLIAAEVRERQHPACEHCGQDAERIAKMLGVAAVRAVWRLMLPTFWRMKRSALDTQLVAVPFAMAFATALTLHFRADLFPRLLSFDVSFLAQAHVFATFCRVWTMGLTRRQKRILTIDSLALVVIASVLVVTYFHVALIATAYMVWQMFHYTRQSYGIELLLRRRSGRPPSAAVSRLLFTSAAAAFFWALSRATDRFLGMPIFILPHALARVLSVCCAIAAAQAIVQLAWHRGEGFGHPVVFTLSHVIVFVSAYTLLTTLDNAWLVSNMWHNAQYLLIVRNALGSSALDNVKPSSRAAVLASAAAGLPFLTACAVGGGLAYGLLGDFMRTALAQAAGVVIAIYMGINFHHYVVDGLVWKRRSRVLESLA